MAKKPARKATKKPAWKSISGLSEQGVRDMIRDEAFARLGLKGYPWSSKLRAQMLDGAQACADRDAILKMIDDMGQKETPRPA